MANVPVMRALLEHGADRKKKDSKGRMAADYAASYKYSKPEAWKAVNEVLNPTGS